MKTLPKINRACEFVLKKEHKERPTMIKDSSGKMVRKFKSLTEPNNAYTVKELFRRFSRNMPTNVSQKIGTYNMTDQDSDFDSPDLEKVKHMDPVERDNMITELKFKRRQLEARVKQENADEQNRKSLEKEKSDEKLFIEFEKIMKEKNAAGVGDSRPSPAKGGSK